MNTFQDQTMQHSFKFRFDLLAGLSRFGLNPSDWDLVPSAENIFFIQNREEPTWYFKGTLGPDKSRPVWNEIELLSL